MAEMLNACLKKLAKTNNSFFVLLIKCLIKLNKVAANGRNIKRKEHGLIKFNYSVWKLSKQGLLFVSLSDCCHNWREMKEKCFLNECITML